MIGCRWYSTERVCRRGSLTLAVMLILLFAAPAGALDVAEDELNRADGVDIEFTNYEGPVSVSESVEMIESIGRYLGDPPADIGGFREYFARYRIVRAVDPDTRMGLDADIFYILEQARVDHIRNVRLILSGYLRQVHDYNQQQAALIAELATIYNALYRGDLANFEERYKEIVVENLTAERVGLSTHYNDWPGGTELVIPLRSDVAVVDPFRLADEEVIEELRRRDDMGISMRTALIDLMEDVVAIAREELREERERFAAELDELEAREREVLEEREMLDDLDEEERAEAEERVEQAEVEISERVAELDERTRAIAEREAEVTEMEERVQEERDAVAEDVDEVMDDDEVVVAEDPEIAAVAEEELPDDDTVVVIEAERREDGRSGRLVRLYLTDGSVDARSDIDRIASTRLHTIAGDFLVSRRIGNSEGVLVRVDPEELDISFESESVVFAESYLAIGDGSVYSVVMLNGTWHLGRFNEQLEQVAVSDIEVDPDTFLYIDDSIVIAQGRDGAFHVLDAETLE